MEQKLDGRLNPKFRLILLGSKKVGKSSLINQMINNNFRPEYYPTKDLVIYKMLYNFTPKSGDFDDFCYIEFIDTMAFDRSKNLKDFSDFFQIHLMKERDLSKSNLSSKISESVLKSIKHEYVSGKENSSKQGLFSNDKIMAYLFIFDYNDDESLTEMLDMYYTITTDESIKSNDESIKTVKCFICNKYPIMIDEIANDISYHDVIKHFMDKDVRTLEIMNKIQKKLSIRDGNAKLISIDAKDITFFTSCKSNVGIRHCFNNIFNKIKHKENLWKKITYENKTQIEQDGKEEEKEEKDNQYNDDDSFTEIGFFCCKKIKKKTEEKNVEDNKDKIESFTNKLNFNDLEEEIGYDMNVSVKPKIQPSLVH